MILEVGFNSSELMLDPWFKAVPSVFKRVYGIDGAVFASFARILWIRIRSFRVGIFVCIYFLFSLSFSISCFFLFHTWKWMVMEIL